MCDISTVATEFISAYYYKLSFSPAEVPKFYDQENALIWRQELERRDGVDFNTASKFLVPEIVKGSKVVIYDYTMLKNEKGFLLTVCGYIKHENEEKKEFQQIFEVEEIDGKYAIVKDILRYAKYTKEEQEEELESKLIKIARKVNVGNKKKGRASKFVYKA